MKVFAVTASPEIQRMRPSNGGTRRRSFSLGDERVTGVFSHQPLYLRELPPEVRDDVHLRHKLVDLPDGAQLFGEEPKGKAETKPPKGKAETKPPKGKAETKPPKGKAEGEPAADDGGSQEANE